MTYEIIRSRRRTLAMEITPRGLVVRAPWAASTAQIEAFVTSHQKWVEKHLARLEERPQAEKLTVEELRELARRAVEVIPPRVAHYAPLVGVSYGRITIRSQRTKWGSCSGKGNLNFNCLLMLAPTEVTDSVVVHELCHRKEMNHSDRFYREVLRVFPDYWKWDRWLKDHGRELMERLPE